MDSRIAAIESLMAELTNKSTVFQPYLVRNQENKLMMAQYSELAKIDCDISTKVVGYLSELAEERCRLLRSQIESKEGDLRLQNMVEEIRARFHEVDERRREVEANLLSSNLEFLNVVPVPNEMMVSKPVPVAEEPVAAQKAVPIGNSAAQKPPLPSEKRSFISRNGIMDPQFLASKKPQYSSLMAQQLTADRTNLAASNREESNHCTTSKLAANSISFAANSTVKKRGECSTGGVAKVSDSCVRRVHVSGGSSLDGSLFESKTPNSAYRELRGQIDSPLRPVPILNFDETADFDSDQSQSVLDRAIVMNDEEVENKNKPNPAKPSYSSNVAKQYSSHQSQPVPLPLCPTPIRPSVDRFLPGQRPQTSSDLPPRPQYASSSLWSKYNQ